MSLNGTLGLGIQISAQNMTGGTFSQLNGALQDLMGAARNVGHAGHEAGAGLNGMKLDANGRWHDAAGRFAAAGQAMHGMGDAAVQAGHQTEQGTNQMAGGLHKVGHAAKHAHHAAAALKEIATASFEFAKSIAEPLDKCIESSDAFGKAIALASTKTNEAQFSTKELHDSALELSQTYGKMPVDEAKALTTAIQLGANNAADAQNLLNASNKLAIGTNSDLDQTVTTVAKTLKAYQMSMSEAEHVTDVFAVTMSQGKISANDLQMSVGKIAARAHSAGVSLEEVSAAVVVLSSNGMKATQSAGALNSAMTAIISPSKAATAEAKRLGISFDASTLKSKGFAGVLRDVHGSSKLAGDSIEKLFGKSKAGQAVTLLTEHMDHLDQSMAELGNSAGATDGIFDKMSDTLSHSKDKFAATQEVAKILIGEALEPIMKKVVDFGSTVVKAFNRIPAPVRDVIVKLVAGAAAVAGVVGVAATAIAGIGSAIGAIAGIASLGEVLVVLLPLLAVIGGIAAAVWAVSDAVEHNVGGMGGKFKSLGDTVKLVFGGLEQAFGDGGFSGNIRKELNKAENAGIKQFVINVYSFVMKVKHFFAEVSEGFHAAVAKMGPTFERLTGAFDKLLSRLGLGSNNVEKSKASWEAWGAAGQKVGTWIADAADKILNGISAAMEMADGFASTWDDITASAKETWKSLGPLGDQLTDLGKDIGLISADGVTTSWKDLGKTVGETIASGIAAIQPFIRYIEGINQAYGGMIKMVTGLLHGDWHEAWEGAKQVMFGVFKAAGEVAYGIAAVVAGLLDKLDKLGGGKGTSHMDSLNEWHKEMLDRTNVAEESSKDSDKDYRDNEKEEKYQRSKGGWLTNQLSQIGAMSNGAPTSDAAAFVPMGPTNPDNNLGATIVSAIKGAPNIINVHLDGELIASHFRGDGPRDTAPDNR